MHYRQKQARDKFSQYLDNKIGVNKKISLFSKDFTTPNSSQIDINSYYSIISSQISPEKYMSSSKKQQSLSLSTVKSKKRRKLIKMSQMEENLCAICLDVIKKQCYLPCKHKYCQQCLLIWLEQSSRCPYCRQNAAYYQDSSKNRIKIIQKQMLVQQLEINEMDWVCYRCDITHEGDVVLICDLCQAHACHIQCDQSLMGIQPQERQPWYCHFCRMSNN